uniref:Uncharacterized protein n=1 Tax=Spongospora subterranea TaxID=70186 RepID=A0A0H5R8D7_9EUKA|eukprot:CRZ10398.1 hypothetical protein [Spongospora subterranea]
MAFSISQYEDVLASCSGDYPAIPDPPLSPGSVDLHLSSSPTTILLLSPPLFRSSSCRLRPFSGPVSSGFQRSQSLSGFLPNYSTPQSRLSSTSESTYIDDQLKKNAFISMEIALREGELHGEKYDFCIHNSVLWRPKKSHPRQSKKRSRMFSRALDFDDRKRRKWHTVGGHDQENERCN